MADKLTTQQAQAVSDRGGNLLVSAAAGSGKTKVLTERLLSYILDPVDPANIDDFLIITFTKAAAAELRVKIAAKLSEAIAEHPENQHLQRQMQRLHMAQISTVHSFCTEILREFAYKLDIAADFRMIDMAECPELQQRVLDKVMNSAYVNIAEDDCFRQFIDTQGYGRNDRQVPDIILKTYQSSRCHLDPDAWLGWCESSLNVDNCSDVSETPWGRYLIDDLHGFLDLQIKTFQNCADYAAVTAGMEKPAELLQNTVTQLNALRIAGTWDEVRRNKNIDFGTMRFGKNCEHKELEDHIKAVRKKCTESIKAKLEVFDVENQKALEDLKACGVAAKGIIATVRAFAREYDRLKKSLRVMDFNDLEHRALDLLMGDKRAAPSKLAREVGRRYREVMVDEYQDSNQVQDAIYMALTSEKQNCFMVGDVKQSIYQFRLADPGIFIEKYNSYRNAADAQPGEGRKILLSSNFRSSAGIIDCVNDVFRECMTERTGGLNYGEDEMLREGIDHASLGEPEVMLLAVDVVESTYDEEARVVAAQITDLLDGSHMVRQGSELRPVRPEDIAILIRSRTIVRQLTDALDSAGIPYTTNDAEDLLCSREISVLISLLRVISNPLQDIPLIAVLSSNVFCYSADELAHLRAIERDVPIFRLLEMDDSEKSKSFIDILQHLRADAKVYSVSELLEKVLHTTGFDSVYAAMPDGEERVARIQKFLQFASDYESKGGKTLQQFIEHLDAAAQFGIENTEVSKKPSAVQITTIHKSKGLEYPVVFLMGLSRETNFRSARENVLCDRTLGLGLCRMDAKQRIRYPSIAKRAISVKAVTDTISEEVRVLYVAMTRARDRLIMTYADNKLQDGLNKLSSYMTLFDKALLSAYTVRPGQWILQAAMRRTEAGALFELGGNPGCASVSQIPWSIQVVTAPQCTGAFGIQARDQKNRDALISRLQEKLHYTYPYLGATQIPSKQTATQMKGRRKDAEVAENTTQEQPEAKYYRKPMFISGGFAGKEYGNAYHAVMQYIHYDQCLTAEGLHCELDRLVREKLITEDQRKLVSERKILNFVCSPTGRKVIEGKQVYREFKFSILLDADVECSDEKVLLQGVADCMIVEPDGITVIDFKSDRFAPDAINMKKEEHRPQVEAYARAVERIFQARVKEKILYFFSIDQAVSL